MKREHFVLAFATVFAMSFCACDASLAQSKVWRDSVQGNARVRPDNSRINKRDKNDIERTADDQGQSANDVEITRKIRRAITEDDSLSVYAQNIKVITVNGIVTLKGPVRNEGEKRAIEQKAVAVAGASNVTNELEIAAKDLR